MKTAKRPQGGAQESTARSRPRRSRVFPGKGRGRARAGWDGRAGARGGEGRGGGGGGGEVVGERAREVRPVERQELALLDRDGGGRARLVVEERHLPEKVARPEHGEDDLPTIVPQDRDLDPPLQD